MNRTHTIRLVIAALAVAVLLVAVIGLPGGTSSSAGQTTVTRLPRPHPQAQRRATPAVIPISASYETLYPRPHPKSHIRLTMTSISQP